MRTVCRRKAFPEMQWQKLGQIFCGQGQHPWMHSHASQPFAERIDADLYRIYFTVRDQLNRSHIAWIEIDIGKPNRVLRVSESPVLAPGATGTFDDAGAMMSCLTRDGGKRNLFYTGWSLRKSVPYHWSIGVAVGDTEPGPPSVRKFSGPILERSPVDPLLCASPYVIVADGHWRMWYLSGVGWPKVENGVTPSYNMRYAESQNGVDWDRTGRVVLALEPDELGFSRPSILSDRQAYQMWYSVRRRSKPYRLGFAYSQDGLAWIRDDGAAGLEPSADGWDAEMIAYPHVFDHGRDRYMLYCGNGYGLTGFGLAVSI